ncbi:AsmA family protein [Hanstruepera neustonica]|uniref:AsmA family protein n=1 Tax=Hanstruepera neustonica TaxID=1445657 RepID=A0A2K1E0Z8_9FLAO|nr:AsmA-like C-terminal region-containing protein [Hanstruepera neustonica]PNQ73962.1 AsmA family protein [Hanstruepera neustonica]
MKKVFKIIGITLLIFLLILFAIPFVLQSQIETIVQRYADENLNAKVSFSSVNLSLIKSFPNAQVDINDLAITTYKPFEGETLATSKSISLTLPIAEVFKTSGDEALIINKIYVDETLLTLKTNKLGDVNYDILKPSKNNDQDLSDSNGFTFDVQDYRIENSALTYIDETNNTTFYITEFNHIGKGTFSGDISELETETDARLSLTIDSTNYLNNNTLKLDALIDLDLANNKYTFKENTGYINDLLLKFDGFVQQVDNGQQFDLSFQNPGASFKDFLAVIPSNYSKSIADVETQGDFKVNGIIRGLLSEETIPELDISILSNNASFKYPDLPKRVENISIDAALKNTTGNPDETFVNINRFNFKIDADEFKSSATLKNITENMLVNANIDGTLNLANISKAYPIELEKELSGILKAKLNTEFDMNAIETNAYNRIKNNGTASVSDFVFSSEDIVNPIHIKTAQMSFNPGTVSLNAFDAISGNSDIAATGTITNLLGFLLSDKNLQGTFNVNSKQFLVSDFMVADDDSIESNKTTSEGESLKIPAFLDCTINANVQTVVYDNLNLKNVTGKLVIKDQIASLQNMTSNIFDGKMTIAGDVNTQAKTPSFNLNLGADGFDIAQSFTDLDLLHALAPIAKVFNGKLNSTINLQGMLNESFSPNLQTVSGNAFAELMTTQFNSDNSTVLKALEDKISFVDFDKLNLKDLKTSLTFEDGGVNVKPFYLKYDDIDIAVAGNHGFDKTMDYDVVFNVPAKYLGSDVNRLIGQINDPEVNKISIPVTANLTGSFTNPQVKTDLSSSVSNLMNQLLEIQKQKLLNQGQDTVKDILGDIISGNSENTNDSSSTQDSTSSNTTSGQQTIKNILGGILNKNKKEKDTLN